MRLLTGPAGSGKTIRVLEEFTASQARPGGDSGARLLAPTATLQQHLQNELARRGQVVRSACVSTLARFTAQIAPELTLVNPEFFPLMVARAVNAVARPEFAKVAGMDGFHSRLAATISDLDAAGCSPEILAGMREDLAPFRDAVVAIWRNVDRQMRQRRLVLRGSMLQTITASLAARRIPSHIWMHGFAQFSGPELDLILALGRRCHLTLTLPEGVSPNAKRLLLEGGFVEEKLEGGRRPAVVLERLESIEREVDEISRIILERSRGGTPFREMGVILRQPAKYEDLLQTAFDRCGIPARFYSGQALPVNPGGRRMLALVEAWRAGWEHESVLAVLRLAPGLADSDALDHFEIKVREQLPGHGLEPLLVLAGQRRALIRILQSFARLDAWPAAAIPAQWAQRLQTLPGLFWPGYPADRLPRERALLVRAEVAGLQAFTEAVDLAAGWFEDSTAAISFQDFWAVLRPIIKSTAVRAGSRAQNMVRVLSAYEARQWRLSAAFVCGLIEKEFPAQPGRDPFFSDAALRDLARFGVRARTSADLEEEERALFQSAASCARDLLVLTYPRTDSRGQRTLPTGFIDAASARHVEVAVRPALPVSAGRRQPSRVDSPELLANLADNHQTFSVTHLESLLQCPFQFFSTRVLRVYEMPLAPEDRLDHLLQGSIAHETLQAWLIQGKPLIEPVFAEVFARQCERKRVPSGFRRERLRRSLLSALRKFAAFTGYSHHGRSLVEQPFDLQIDPGLSITGKLDRIDIRDDGSAVLIDYKFSSTANTKTRVEDETKLQGPLYAFAARHFLGIEPAAMGYISLKGEKVEMHGWGQPVSPRPLTAEWMDAAVDRVRAAVSEFRAGEIRPRPAQADPCRYCDYRDACRVNQPLAIPASGAWQREVGAG